MKKVLVSLFSLLVLAGIVNAKDPSEGTSFKPFDAVAPVAIRYTGTGATRTIQVTASAIILNNNGTLTTNSLGGATIATLVADIQADTGWEAKAWGSITSDTVADSDLITKAATQVGIKEWRTDFGYWDSSVDQHIDVVLSRIDGNKSITTPRQIKKVFGHAGGTGAITFTLYSGDDVKWTKVVRSPIYLHSATGTTETFAADEVGPANFNLDVDVVLDTTKVAFIRAARATTTTNVGGIGATYENK